jgi:hypothetical protein
VTRWDTFAKREHVRVIRELGFPGALPPFSPYQQYCRRHGTRLGSLTRMCLACHHASWDEVARRYRAQKTRPTGAYMEGANSAGT